MQRRQARKEGFHVIGDFGHGADGGAGAADGVGLFDGHCGGQPFDVFHLGRIHPVEELARVSRETLDVAPLAFRVDGIERQAAFARTARPVTMVIWRRGIFRLRFLRLCCRAPRISMNCRAKSRTPNKKMTPRTGSGQASFR
jgi:hypothetical protein